MQEVEGGHCIVDRKKWISLRMERQCLLDKADEAEYIKLFRDTQPGQNVFWNGFGQPPTLTFRARFDDVALNRERQRERKLIKGRFAGGNLGWIVAEDLELFMALYRKPLPKPTETQRKLLALIESAGPFTIQQIKEETGLLVKEITPILHRLQEAFLIYEDQYDGEWDRGGYRFGEFFPGIDAEKYTRIEALKIVLQRFAHRLVWFNIEMAKSFYKIPSKEIQLAATELEKEGVLVSVDAGYVLFGDMEKLQTYEPKPMRFVYAIHRNDFLYKANEYRLKEWIKPLTENLAYDCGPLQYLLIDGGLRGVGRAFS
ncbi:MAG: hypothetical protein ACOYI8_09115 [Christensenellales bacterium]|jgi:hypothetical protein